MSVILKCTLSSTLSHRRNPASNYCAAHTRDGGGNRISTPARVPRWGPRFWRDLSVVPAGLSISADLRRFLALSKRFPDCRVRPAARYRSLAHQLLAGIRDAEMSAH